MFPKTDETIKQKVVDAYTAIADQYADSHQTAWRGFEDLSRYVDKGAAVLDLGCGNGWVFGSLKGKSVDYLGIDNNSALLELAQTYFPEARFQFGDMVDLELPDDRFDVVLSLASFHHVSGHGPRRQCIGEIHRVLKDDGILILSVWNLFQWRFVAQWVAALFSFIAHLGLKTDWNDLWVPWRNTGPKRYFHAFLPKELLGYFGKDQWTIEEFYFLRKGIKVRFPKSWNLCLVARKKHA